MSDCKKDGRLICNGQYGGFAMCDVARTDVDTMGFSYAECTYKARVSTSRHCASAANKIDEVA